MRQTIALFVDAYRELNARKLFWLILMLSGLVVLSFAIVGIDEQGLTMLWWKLGFGPNTLMMPKATFYKILFMGLGFKFWLAWLATILALVSTAGIFPDFVSSGSIELVLSKPIGRLRLFLTKYATGLLFVTLQVSIFAVLSFLVIGLRGGEWVWGILWAIPVMVIFFSYLFSICALLGIVTRSTVAALLLTLLVWAMIFMLHAGESGLLSAEYMQQQKIQNIERQIASIEGALAKAEETEEADSEVDHALVERQRGRLETKREALGDAEHAAKLIKRFHRWSYGIKTSLPKTTETIALLERKLISATEMEHMLDNSDEPPPFAMDNEIDQKQLQKELATELRNRPVWWVVGTSLIFEAFMLALASWRFCRRDF